MGNRMEKREAPPSVNDAIRLGKLTAGRVGPIYRTLQNTKLYRHARIRINGGKTQLWNSGGIRQEFCDMLERLAQKEDPDAKVWLGSNLRSIERGVTVLGTPLGNAEFVRGRNWQIMRFLCPAFHWTSNHSTNLLKAITWVVEMFGTHHPGECGEGQNSENNSISAFGDAAN